MVDEIVENSVELDPVKRTWVYKPKVIKKRGRLRWFSAGICNYKLGYKSHDLL